MTDFLRLDQGLRAVLRELEPYLADVVLIGGWVPYLYRHYGEYGEWGGRDTLTRELDVLVSRSMPGGDRPPLAQLLARARFRSEAPAVWVRDVEAGEKIEFLAAHRGIARGSGVPVLLDNQPGLFVIPLPGLELLLDSTQILHLPAPDNLPPPLDVRVPTLGAYVVGKAATFMLRGDRLDDDGNPKKAKDLLYLRDLMAAGALVVDDIEDDVERIGSGSHGGMVRTAANHLGLVVRDRSNPLPGMVARMVIAREPSMRMEDAKARTRGYLTDLFEILEDVARTHDH